MLAVVGCTPRCVCGGGGGEHGYMDALVRLLLLVSHHIATSQLFVLSEQ